MRISSVLCPVVLAVLLFPGPSASARPIPPGAEKEFLRLLSPYGVEAPADRIGNTVLESVAIGPDVVRIGLKHGDSAAEVILGDRGTGPAEGVLGQTKSFDVWVTAPLPDDELRSASQALLEAVGSNDSGGFWDGIPAPESWVEPGDSPAPVEGPPILPRYLGELLLLALLVLTVLSARSILPLLKGRKWHFWAAVAVALAIGAYHRTSLQPAPDLVPSQQPVEAPQCTEISQCDDHTPCTVDRCLYGTCVHEWGPEPGTELPCCRTDADCSPAETSGQAIFCSPESFLCTVRVAGVTPASQEEGLATPPLHVPAAWLYGIPAKFAGYSFQTVRSTNLVLSVVSILLLALLLAAWGAGDLAAAAAAILYAVLPASIVVARTTSMTGMLLPLGLVLGIALAPLLVPTSKPSRGWTEGLIPPAMLCALLLFVLGATRPEALLLVVPIAVLLTSGRRFRMLGTPVLSILGGSVLVTLLFRALAFTVPETAMQFPMLSKSPLDDLVAGLMVVLGGTAAFPSLLLALTLVGIVPAFRKSPRLLLLWSLLFVAVPVVLSVFYLSAEEAVRYTLLPALALPVVAGFGVEWLAGLKTRFGWLIAAGVVLYLAASPYYDAAALGEAVKAHEIWLPFLTL